MRVRCSRLRISDARSNAGEHQVERRHDPVALWIEIDDWISEILRADGREIGRIEKHALTLYGEHRIEPREFATNLWQQRCHKACAEMIQVMMLDAHQEWLHGPCRPHRVYEDIELPNRHPQTRAR